MTREDVRAQLVKNPLMWKSTGIPDEQSTSLEARILLLPEEDDEEEDDRLYVEFTLSTNRKYKHSVVYLDVHGRWEFGKYEVAKAIGVEVPVEKLKAIAEDHRLDLVCRLLGIKD